MSFAHIQQLAIPTSDTFRLRCSPRDICFESIHCWQPPVGPPDKETKTENWIWIEKILEFICLSVIDRDTICQKNHFGGREMPMEFIRLTCVRPREQQATALGRGRGRSVCLALQARARLWDPGGSHPSRFIINEITINRRDGL